jgi:hypothetical protein
MAALKPGELRERLKIFKKILSQARTVHTVLKRKYCMQTFKCDLCKEVKDIELAVGFKTNSQRNNYKADKAHRCQPCNTAQAREWRKKNPGYRGSGKLKTIPREDRLLVSAISARLSDAKARANKRKHPFDIDREYLYQLFKDQNRTCALSGVELRIEKGHFCCLSLDQINPTLGYIKGNVQWVAWAVNRAKGDMPSEMFTDMCMKVIEYGKVQRLSKSAA